jgi:tetratricopeptide (TPR) repeat protein
LPRDHAAARACVLLRVADYRAALPELQRAIEKDPVDPYWRLYRLTALRRLGCASPPSAVPATDAWPGPLLGLFDGRLPPSETLGRADNSARRAETLFQLGIKAYARDREEARQCWAQVIAVASPDTIEYAAASHELHRFGMSSPRL